MQVPGTCRRALVLGALAAAALTVTLAASGAPSERADELRSENAQLAGESEQALAAVASLDARLEAAHADLARVRGRVREVTRNQADARAQLANARRALRTAERGLAHRLRALYRHESPDAVAVVLGAKTLDEALTGLEQLERTAEQDKDVAGRAAGARRQLAGLTRRLAARRAELVELSARAAASVTALSQARAERIRYVQQLLAARRANAVQAAALDARAVASARVPPATPVAQPAEREASPAPQRATGVPVPPGGRALTVIATAYALTGTTATGVPVGWGVVAVDPAVIPLGSRMAIPGYGTGVAADTGGAIRGARIDLWFPTEAAALAWGSRSVTIIVYPH